MSVCPVAIDLSNYLDKEEKALAEFTSCLPEYRDKVANEVVALLDGEKTDEEFYDVFPHMEEWSWDTNILAIRKYLGTFFRKDVERAKQLVQEALAYYSEVLYNCSLDEMLEDNDGTTLESWIESVL